MAAFLALPASAQEAAELYRAGQYQAAIAAGERTGSADALIAAAQGAFADATLRDAPCAACLQRAHDLAKRAIAADPTRPRAYVILTVTIGYQARIAGALGSLRARYGEESKAAVETMLKLAPNDPWVLATAGGWHIELTRAIGSLLSRMMYGAPFDEGVAYFKRALAADPADATLQVQYALALSSMAFDSMRAEVRAALVAAERAPARDAYDGAMKERGATLLQLLDQGRDADYLALTRRTLGIPQG